MSFVFKEILHLFHCCRDMDRLMETCFFDESLFDGHLADIRKRLRKEKQDKIASRVLHRLQAQQKAGSLNDEGKGEGGGEDGGGVNKEAKEEKMIVDENDAGGTAAAQSAATSAAAPSAEENDPEYGVIWQLCSKVCNLLTVNMSEAKEEISKRVTQLKSDARSKADDDVGDGAAKAEGDDAADAAASSSPVSKDDSTTSLTPEADAAGATASVNGAAGSAVSLRPAESFLALPVAPESHKFHAKSTIPVDQRAFAAAVRKELKLMASSLPSGIFVRYTYKHIRSHSLLNQLLSSFRA